VTHRLILSAVLIVVTMVILEWFESGRARMTLARRQRREELGTGSAMRLPEHIPTRHHRRPREEGDSMKSLLAAITGLVLAVFANPASAYVVEITTSIPTASALDKAQLRDALRSAIDDVLRHAIAFTPTIVTLQSARVVGDRIYILLLIADGDGEETMKRLSPEEPAANDSSRESLPPGGGYRY